MPRIDKKAGWMGFLSGIRTAVIGLKLMPGSAT